MNGKMAEIFKRDQDENARKDVGEVFSRVRLYGSGVAARSKHWLGLSKACRLVKPSKV